MVYDQSTSRSNSNLMLSSRRLMLKNRRNLTFIDNNNNNNKGHLYSAFPMGLAQSALHYCLKVFQELKQIYEHELS